MLDEESDEDPLIYYFQCRYQHRLDGKVILWPAEPEGLRLHIRPLCESISSVLLSPKIPGKSNML